MTPEELSDAALDAIWPAVREPKRTRELHDFRRSRYADMALTAAGEIILAGGRHGESAQALHSAALERAGIKPAQFARLAPWAQERVLQAVGQMLVMTGTKRKTGRRKSILTAIAATETLALETKPAPVRLIARMLAGTIVTEQKAGETTVRRGRPPKAGVAMSGAERQKALQERRKAAEAALAEIRKAVDFALRTKPVPPHERRLLTKMQAIDNILTRVGI